jgi:hypothetical protein
LEKPETKLKRIMRKGARHSATKEATPDTSGKKRKEMTPLVAMTQPA